MLLLVARKLQWFLKWRSTTRVRHRRVRKMHSVPNSMVQPNVLVFRPTKGILTHRAADQNVLQIQIVLITLPAQINTAEILV